MHWVALGQVLQELSALREVFHICHEEVEIHLIATGQLAIDASKRGWNDEVSDTAKRRGLVLAPGIPLHV